MRIQHYVVTGALLFSVCAMSARADEVVTPTAVTPQQQTLIQRYTAKAQAATQAATQATQAALSQALDLLGIRYRMGGTTPENGFDCSGFVGHVFKEGLGMVLPRTAKEISQTGEVVAQDELKPGDLVFFNTMRRTFSHVGIYLGNNQFVHAPRSGGQVRIEDMRDTYWTKRFNGARRLTDTN